jgi:hypothetical protein
MTHVEKIGYTRSDFKVEFSERLFALRFVALAPWCVPGTSHQHALLGQSVECFERGQGCE